MGYVTRVAQGSISSESCHFLARSLDSIQQTLRHPVAHPCETNSNSDRDGDGNGNSDRDRDRDGDRDGDND